ncbi:Na-Ca exchanger/integrin-beta4 [Halothece sp. PCC 7418]|uniref:Calx-beta domain-containing protein n=1 Tax=Halothece sp. (strain PCC 7418) TaxID=65093 RepID=UPI0002A08DC5|nr:Calx-beta domain-containing protein [Halothece sp. PCC 7418]AFZ45892.1 Na-Ca exchanger/integrin-beta4 [Halothece sp. PCC 7418]
MALIANPDSYRISQFDPGPFLFNVLDNDFDVEGGPLSISSFTFDGREYVVQQQGGVPIQTSGGGNLTLVDPNQGIFEYVRFGNGDVWYFEYEVTDNQSFTDTATVEIHIGLVPPVFSPQPQTRLQTTLYDGTTPDNVLDFPGSDALVNDAVDENWTFTQADILNQTVSPVPDPQRTGIGYDSNGAGTFLDSSAPNTYAGFTRFVNRASAGFNEDVETVNQTLSSSPDSPFVFDQSLNLLLDDDAGYTISFTAQLNGGELSLVAIGDDPKESIEINITPGEIFASSTNLSFGEFLPESESVLFSTANFSAPINFELEVSSGSYTLTARDLGGGQIAPELTGSLKDYTNSPINLGAAIDGVDINPYNLPNSIFVGDNGVTSGTNAIIGSIAVSSNSARILENTTQVLDFDDTDANGNPLSFGISGDDDSFFSINSNGVLSFISAPNFETPQDFDSKNTYEVGVTATSPSGTDTRTLSIEVEDVNEAPTDITLSNSSVDENSTDSVVGTFSTTDPDTGDSFTYSLVSGVGDSDNNLFTINGEELSLDVSPDFESQDSYSIRVQTDDDNGGTFTETFTIDVNDQGIVSIDNPSVTETDTDQTITFTLSVDDPLSEGFTVNYQTDDRTAFDNGFDYVATSGSLSFDPNQTSSEVDVTVLGDDISEATEEFALQLSNANNSQVTIADTEGIATITDDDTAPTIRVNDASVVEGDSGSTSINFVVKLSAPSGQEIAFDYTTADDTAVAGEDYTATSGSFSFVPGNTTTSISVPVSGDKDNEGDEQFTLNLSNVSSEVSLSDAEATGTILGDDTGSSLPTISGTSSDDYLVGSNGDESLEGKEGDDILIGLGGTNTFQGDAGSDYLLGYGGQDTFIFPNLSDSSLSSLDDIGYFNTEETDRLDISSNPDALSSVGVISAPSLSKAVQTAYNDNNVGVNEAVFFEFDSRIYLSVNDGTADFSETDDLLVQFGTFVGGLPAEESLTVTDYFAT